MVNLQAEVYIVIEVEDTKNPIGMSIGNDGIVIRLSHNRLKLTTKFSYGQKTKVETYNHEYIEHLYDKFIYSYPCKLLHTKNAIYNIIITSLYFGILNDVLKF